MASREWFRIHFVQTSYSSLCPTEKGSAQVAVALWCPGVQIAAAHHGHQGTRERPAAVEETEKTNHCRNRSMGSTVSTVHVASVKPWQMDPLRRQQERFQHFDQWIFGRYLSQRHQPCDLATGCTEAALPVV